MPYILVRCTTLILTGGCFCAVILILENHNDTLEQEKVSSSLFPIGYLLDPSHKSSEVTSAEKTGDSTVLLCVNVKQSDV